MRTVPQDLALLYAAPPGSEAARRMRQVLELGGQPAKTLAAATLIELVLADRMTVQSQRRRLVRSDVVIVTSAGSTGDTHLDEVLRQIAASDVRSCASWIRELSKDSRDVYLDRFVPQSLGAPETAGGTGVVDEEAVRSVRTRLRAVLAGSQAVQPRDVALVVLLAHIGHLSMLLEDPEWMSSRPLAAAKTTKHDERLGRDATDVYRELADFDAITRIAEAAAPDPGG